MSTPKVNRVVYVSICDSIALTILRLTLHVYSNHVYINVIYT